MSDKRELTIAEQEYIKSNRTKSPKSLSEDCGDIGVVVVKRFLKTLTVDTKTVVDIEIPDTDFKKLVVNKTANKNSGVAVMTEAASGLSDEEVKTNRAKAAKVNESVIYRPKKHNG